MARPSWRQILRGPSLQEDLADIGRTAAKHLREQTIQPLKDTARYAAFGAAGSVFVALGTVMLLLGALRYVQWQFPALDGTLSFIPYLVVVVLALFVMGLCAWRIVSGPARRRLAPKAKK
ncbi:MAG TPA: hypothetical protein VGS61_02110 [Acidimicrobiales bacterium]|nr:hypothetical protein [Acidimicrobiales bacterium]